MKDRRKCASGKSRFATMELAKEALSHARQARKRGLSRRREVRYYSCDLCNGWHLTSNLSSAQKIRVSAWLSPPEPVQPDVLLVPQGHTATLLLGGGMSRTVQGTGEVRVSGAGTLWAGGDLRVIASGPGLVVADERVRVTALDGSTVWANGDAVVCAHPSASVRLNDRARQLPWPVGPELAEGQATA